MQRLQPQGYSAGSAIQQGIAGALGRRGVIGCGERFHPGGPLQQAGLHPQLTDRHGEVVPTGHAGIAPLQDAGAGGVSGGICSHPDRPPTGRRQGEGAGGAAHLIGHHPQCFTGRCLQGVEPQHRETEIFAHWAIHPTGAQQPGAGQGQGRRLPRRLGGAIHTERIKPLLGPIRRTLSPVEHKVGAHLQQPAARCRKGLSKGRRRAGIHRRRQLRLAFGLVHRRVGAGIEHPIGPMLLHRRPAGIGIGQIQLAAAAGDQLHLGRPGGDQLLAQLAGGAGEQHLHQNRSPSASSANNGATASLSDSWGSAPARASRGQAIASAGSSQRMARSHSRLQKSVVL